MGRQKKKHVPKTGEKKRQVPKDTAGRFCLLKVQKVAKVGNVMFSLARKARGLPGGSAVRNLPANAGDVGCIPDSGRSTCCRATKPLLSTALQSQLPSPCAATAEVRVPGAGAHSERRHTVRSLHTASRERHPLAATRESLHGTEDSAQPKQRKRREKQELINTKFRTAGCERAPGSM